MCPRPNHRSLKNHSFNAPSLKRTFKLSKRRKSLKVCNYGQLTGCSGNRLVFPNEEVREESELTRADENVGRASRGEREKGGKKERTRRGQIAWRGEAIVCSRRELKGNSARNTGRMSPLVALVVQLDTN